jgi:hypothetical protein
MSVNDLILPSPAELRTEFRAGGKRGSAAFSVIECWPEPEPEELCGH